jgi:hypothetical protein
LPRINRDVGDMRVSVVWTTAHAVSAESFCAERSVGPKLPFGKPNWLICAMTCRGRLLILSVGKPRDPPIGCNCFVGIAREETWGQLMLALYRCCRKADALASNSVLPYQGIWN